ncbi:MAG TPA: AMP-binding protein [Ilumatobacteraceae bacterium]|nr:AMP-binding protein [Ilumatobacteraceae bacterium]HRB01741.1 AMP-binding protein [Ilumatobacteraceae bacterium]
MKELVYHRQFFPMLERWPNKVGFHDGDYHGTFAQHGDRVLRLADAMRTELGMKPGDRFAVMSCNSHEYLELYHAAFLGASIINPLNLRLAGAELQHILADSGATVAFVDAVFADHFLRNIADVRKDLPLKHIVLIGDADVKIKLRYEDLIKAGRPNVPTEPEETDPVVLMYTGGTTGKAKGVLLEQRAEMLNFYHVGMAVEFGDERVYLHQTPMFHAASMAGILGLPTTGGTSVFVPLFEPGQVMDLIERYGVDWTVMVPTMIALMMDHPEFSPERVASLKDLVYGASPMPAALMDRLMVTFPGVRLWQGYGMTECSSILTMLSPADHRRSGVRQSAGRPVIGVTLSIRDTDGNVVPRGQDGEVWAQGGNFMREYWRQPKATKEAFSDGWYRTGDAGHLDDEGYLHLVDRVKDMIITGGENVYSIEVENAISTHPSVAQVAVIGIPHEVWGEQVHAIVVLRPGMEATVDQIKEHARGSIAGYKVPKSVEFRTEPIPLSGALKPLKRELRKAYWPA